MNNDLSLHGEISEANLNRQMSVMNRLIDCLNFIDS